MVISIEVLVLSADGHCRARSGPAVIDCWLLGLGELWGEPVLEAVAVGDGVDEEEFGA